MRRLVFGLVGLCAPSPSGSRVLPSLPPPCRQLRGTSLVVREHDGSAGVPITCAMRLGVPFPRPDGLNAAADILQALSPFHSGSLPSGQHPLQAKLRKRTPRPSRVFSRKSVGRPMFSVVAPSLCRCSLTKVTQIASHGPLKPHKTLIYPDFDQTSFVVAFVAGLGVCLTFVPSPSTLAPDASSVGNAKPRSRTCEVGVDSAVRSRNVPNKSGVK